MNSHCVPGFWAMLPALVPAIWRAVACAASKGRAETQQGLQPFKLWSQEDLPQALFMRNMNFSTIYGSME